MPHRPSRSAAPHQVPFQPIQPTTLVKVQQALWPSIKTYLQELFPSRSMELPVFTTYKADLSKKWHQASTSLLRGKKYGSSNETVPKTRKIKKNEQKLKKNHRILCSIKKKLYLCTRKTERCHSSVGRAKDWKSLCPRFDSWWHHVRRKQLSHDNCFFYTNWSNCSLT